jgi:hypothetical protein
LPFSQLQKPPLGSQLNRSHPLSRGLVGCWLLNEGGGTKIFDLSGNGTHGTFNGNVAFNLSPKGTQVYFDGAGDYVDCGDVSILDGIKSASFVIGIVPVAALDKAIVSKMGAAGDRSFQVFQDSATNTEFCGDVWDGATRLFLRSSGAALVSGVPAVVSFVWQGLNSGQLYKDGVLLANSTVVGTSPVSITNSSVTLQFGKDAGSADGYYTGGINYVFIYNRALSSQEVALLYASPYEMFEEELPLELLYVASPATYRQRVIII